MSPEDRRTRIDHFTEFLESLGFQVVDIHSGFALLLVWFLGGVFALCGALSYGELAAAMPRSGGEFHFLGRIFHPALGFLSGWISITPRCCSSATRTLN